MKISDCNCKKFKTIDGLDEWKKNYISHLYFPRMRSQQTKVLLFLQAENFHENFQIFLNLLENNELFFMRLTRHLNTASSQFPPSHPMWLHFAGNSEFFFDSMFWVDCISRQCWIELQKNVLMKTSLRIVVNFNVRRQWKKKYHKHNRKPRKITALNPARDICDLHELHLAIFRFQFVQWSLILLSDRLCCISSVSLCGVWLFDRALQLCTFFCRSLFWSQVQICSLTRTSNSRVFLFNGKLHFFVLSWTRVEPRSSLLDTVVASHIWSQSTRRFSMRNVCACIAIALALEMIRRRKKIDNLQT